MTGTPKSRFPYICPIRQGLSRKKAGLKQASGLARPGMTETGVFRRVIPIGI